MFWNITGIQRLSESEFISASRVVKICALMFGDTYVGTDGAFCGVIAPNSRSVSSGGFRSVSVYVPSISVVRRTTS